jgi:two-component system alkaline phosphatase synthesis response regulator PhoP
MIEDANYLVVQKVLRRDEKYCRRMDRCITEISILTGMGFTDILDFLQYNLEREGYKVFTAKNGLEGVEMVQKVRPALILIDVMMPVMDGIEACYTIRKNTQITQPIIAFLTSRAEDYSQVAGFEAGADDYIAKPIRPRLLVSQV